ncbi:MAG TPA: heme-binding domain-containing protein [Thermoflexales bacterium]|nr:heme-binding domain-containing protein [Thermoflexales bacterium]HQW36347.1 heme-binding domain-containing protein [Thermoflexales bacterium]HQX75067.1 heme-binding domain-containing protein [Thermoflexales bacterium]HRA00863.1 heme-binding domain-containing protein [Thermoflexales bacterium]
MKLGKTLLTAGGAFVALLAVASLATASAHTNPPVVAEPKWDSPQTRATFMQVCGDCHSNETNWKWYTGIAPFSLLINHDVFEGREKFNVSEWGARRMDSREAAEQYQKGEMPPPVYMPLHPEAKLTGAARDEFIKGLQATFGSGGGPRTRP